MRYSNCAASSADFSEKTVRVSQRKTRLQNPLQLDLTLQERPPVKLTEEERREVVAALATLLLLAMRIAADE